MKIYTQILATALCAAALSAPLMGFAQCKEFTENKVMSLLDDYFISGKYNTLKLKEGDEIVIFKTVSKGINYRFVVKGDNEFSLPPQFKIESWEGKIVFDNSENGEEIWDLPCDKTERIKIIVSVPEDDEDAETEGCVTVLSGIKSI